MTTAWKRTVAIDQTLPGWGIGSPKLSHTRRLRDDPPQNRKQAAVAGCRWTSEPKPARDPSAVTRISAHQSKPAKRILGLQCYRQGDGHGRRQRASQDESQGVDPAQGSRPRNQQAPESPAGLKGETRTGKMRPCEVWDMKVWSSHGKRPRQGRGSNVDAVAAAFYSTAAIEF